MTDSLLPPSVPASLPTPTSKKRNWGRILIGLVILLNAGVWIAALAYVKLVPSSYSSELAVFLPAASSSDNLTLSEDAKIDRTILTPYSSLLRVDPRLNYMFIAKSPAVLEVAAASVRMTLEEFGEPLIGMDKGNTIMQFKIEGSTPQEAQKKAIAFYQAFVKQIDSLRDEVRFQEKSRQSTENQLIIKGAQEKLEQANKILADYKRNSPLSRSEQITEMGSSLQELRKQRDLAMAELQQVSGRLGQLSMNLNTSVEKAADILILQSDEVFLKQWAEYSNARVTISSLSSQWQPDSPQMQSAQAKLNSSQTALLSRAAAVLGKPLPEEALQNLDQSLNANSTTRETLLQQIITLQSDQKGLAAKVKSLDEEIAKTDAMIKILIQEQFKLNELERNAKIAEGFFTSTVAQLNLSRPDVATSYPVVQLVSEPSLPAEASGPNKKMPLLGALALTLLSSTGLMLFWWNKPQKKTVNLEPLEPVSAADEDISG